MKVLVVDDSIVFRSGIRQAIDGQDGIEVVSTAIHGEQALEKVNQMDVDLITLDLEMPVLDGISTLKRLRDAGNKTPVIVFSAHSQAGAEKTIEALSAGAQDFLAKRVDSDDPDVDSIESIRKILVPKIIQFHNSIEEIKPVLTPKKPVATVKKKINMNSFMPHAICIGSSTGGPEALKKLFTNWKEKPNVPIFIVQHMPPLFTSHLASMLNSVSPFEVVEAAEGMEVLRNVVYLAPGDYHMEIIKNGDGKFIKLNQNPKVKSVRPAVDVTFLSANDVYAEILGIVLTGMGEDGLDGARKFNESSNPIIIQNEESCIVFGMPGAIFRESLFDFSGDVPEIANYLNKIVS
ncbi:MAG: chemotaxis-specific protein-glutamate methyltransferase CheB [Bdellovibrionales bacterium]